MKPQPSRLQHKERQEQITSEQQTSTQQAGLEFATAEEAIRHDAAQTEVPPAIAERLKESVEQEPRKPGTSWWKRTFGG